MKSTEGAFSGQALSHQQPQRTPMSDRLSPISFADHRGDSRSVPASSQESELGLVFFLSRPRETVAGAFSSRRVVLVCVLIDLMGLLLVPPGLGLRRCQPTSFQF